MIARLAGWWSGSTEVAWRRSRLLRGGDASQRMMRPLGPGSSPRRRTQRTDARTGPLPGRSRPCNGVCAGRGCAEWGAWDSERGFWRFVRARLGHLFPRAVDQSQFNRRRGAFYPALARIRRALVGRLGVALERERFLDTKPVPVMALERYGDRGLVSDGRPRSAGARPGDSTTAASSPCSRSRSAA